MSQIFFSTCPTFLRLSSTLSASLSSISSTFVVCCLKLNNIQLFILSTLKCSSFSFSVSRYRLCRLLSYEKTPARRWKNIFKLYSSFFHNFFLLLIINRSNNQRRVVRVFKFIFSHLLSQRGGNRFVSRLTVVWRACSVGRLEKKKIFPMKIFLVRHFLHFSRV